MATILVTGAAGFIGARTSELLLDAGHTVVGLDNLNDYYAPALKQHRLARLRASAGFQFTEGDIENRRTIEGLFAEHSFDSVINLAARAGVRASIDDPHVYLSTNTNGTLNLLEAMRSRGVKKFVMASTSSLYAGCALPFREDAVVNHPLSPYAASKLAAEAMAYTYHHLFGIDVTVLRYFTVYGPAGRPDMSPYRFVKWIDEGSPIQLFGDGHQTRDFTYIDDIAKGTVLALKPLGYEIVNLGGGNQPLSINWMIRLLEEYLGKQATIVQKPSHATEMRDTRADNSKARMLLGWNPEVLPEDGLRRTAEWYVANRDWLRPLPC
jgi:UDP-glucuronate 4-epimerase